MSVGAVMRARWPGGVRSPNHCLLAALTEPPMLSRHAVFSWSRRGPAARRPVRAGGRGPRSTVPLPQMIALKDVFIAPSGKKPVAGEFHVTSGMIASRRESIAAVASWIPPP